MLVGLEDRKLEQEKYWIPMRRMPSGLSSVNERQSQIPVHCGLLCWGPLGPHVSPGRASVGFQHLSCWDLSEGSRCNVMDKGP